VLDAYLTHLTVERRLAANSIESYARDLNGLAEFAAGRGQNIEHLSRQDLEALVRDMMSQGARRARWHGQSRAIEVSTASF
jgi:site-specific recombinase XerD